MEVVEAIVGTVACLFVVLWFYEKFFAPSSYNGRWVFMYEQGDMLFLQSLAIRRKSGDITVVPKEDAVLDVEGAVRIVPEIEWPASVPSDALFVVELLDEDVVFLSAYSTKYPEVPAYETEIIIADPPIEYVATGWVKVEPAPEPEPEPEPEPVLPE